GGGLTAADMAEQAKKQLSKLMSAPKEPGPTEVFAGDKPVPTEGDLPDLPLSGPRTGPQAPSKMQQNLDELAKEAEKLTLPGEAGRGGMVGRPAAEPAVDWTTGVPLPRERPAAADESPATQAYPG